VGAIGGAWLMSQDDLVAALMVLYVAAGQPSFRRISNEIRDRSDMPDSVSHETVSALLSGTSIPKWTKVESVVRALAGMAVHPRDPEVEVQRFLPLWTAATSGHRVNGPGPLIAVIPEQQPAEVVLPGEAENGTVPPRNPGFTGREEPLRTMRTRLEGEPWQPLILHGLSGVGKTSIAVEYVYRHRERYDLIWWIVAEQVARTRSALAALGERLDLEVSQQDRRQAVNIVLGELEKTNLKWLIVFDNAASPDEIRSLLPAGRGAVIVTTRDGTWTGHGRTVAVDVLPRADSIELLQARGSITFDDADHLAERLGDLPLALEQASAMRTAAGISVPEYLRQLDEHATTVLDSGRPSDYPDTVASAFGLTFDQVKEEFPGAAQLLGMLSCLSAEPVSPALLRSADEREIPPPLGRILAQDAQLEAAVQTLQRFGLLTSVDSAQKLQVHRLAQLIVRGSLTEQERERAYLNARQLLVSANPGQPDEPLTWEMHAQIGPHILPARMLDDPSPRVRRVVLDQARYLYVQGDFDGSLRLSADARKTWAGPDDVWNDDETFGCIDRYALALAGLGRYREANALYEEAWVRLSSHRDFGLGHTRTVRMASGLATVSRTLGNYGKALNLETYRVDFYARHGDPELPELLRARANLAVSYRTLGEYDKAQEIDESLVEYWRNTQDDEDYRTLFAISNLARDLYGLGLYADALGRQQDSMPALRTRLGSRHPYVVLAGRTVAIGLRKTGRLLEALQQSRAHFLVCQGEWGADHGYTLAAAMTYANTIRAVVAADLGGDLTYPHAYNVSLRAVNTYRTRFGEQNPLTLAAATTHAITLRAMGERSTARRTGEGAYHLLNSQLGAAHPYTRAAAVGLGNDLMAAHDHAAAADLLRGALQSAGAGAAEHPDTLITGLNLGLITRDVDPEAGKDLVDRNLSALREALGADHPQVLAAAQARRGECDIEPPPF
jgi:tetratricopeptide (TPR) repeat protein